MFANSAHQKGQAVAHVVEMSTSSTGVLVSVYTMSGFYLENWLLPGLGRNYRTAPQNKESLDTKETLLRSLRASTANCKRMASSRHQRLQNTFQSVY